MQVKKWLSVYRDSEELIQVGAYVSGTNLDVDQAIEKKDQLDKFLMQKSEENITPEETRDSLISL